MYAIRSYYGGVDDHVRIHANVIAVFVFLPRQPPDVEVVVALDVASFLADAGAKGVVDLEVDARVALRNNFV